MVSNAVKEYKNHPSIKVIKISSPQTDQFKCSHVYPWNVMDQIESIDTSKANSGNIPVKILKNSKDTLVPYLTDCINIAINNCDFANDLKITDVSAGYKKGVQTDRSNYWPISVLPPIAKIFERLIASQLNGFIQNKLSNRLSTFRKGYDTQDTLLRVIESWRKGPDASGIVGTVLIDLSKAYDCILHDLLIAKLEDYGLDRNSLKLMCSYLTGRT